MFFTNFSSAKIASITNTTITFESGGIFPTQYPFTMAYWRAKNLLPLEDDTRRVITITGLQSGRTYRYTSDEPLVPLISTADYYAFNVTDESFLNKIVRTDSPQRVWTLATFTADDSDPGFLDPVPGTWALETDTNGFTLATETVTGRTGSGVGLTVDRNPPDRFLFMIFESRTSSGTFVDSQRLYGVEISRSGELYLEDLHGETRAVLTSPIRGVSAGRAGIYIQSAVQQSGAFTTENTFNGEERIIVKAVFTP